IRGRRNGPSPSTPTNSGSASGASPVTDASKRAGNRSRRQASSGSGKLASSSADSGGRGFHASGWAATGAGSAAGGGAATRRPPPARREPARQDHAAPGDGRSQPPGGEQPLPRPRSRTRGPGRRRPRVADLGPRLQLRQAPAQEDGDLRRGREALAGVLGLEP